jgi:hypothetical protein
MLFLQSRFNASNFFLKLTIKYVRLTCKKTDLMINLKKKKRLDENWTKIEKVEKLFFYVSQTIFLKKSFNSYLFDPESFWPLKDFEFKS